MVDFTLVHVPARTLPVKTLTGRTMWRVPIRRKGLCRTCPLLHLCKQRVMAGDYTGCEAPLLKEMKL